MATELIGIELELIGEEGVYRDLEKLDSLIRSIGGRQVINLELGKTKQKLLELKGEINELKNALGKTEKGSDQYKALQSELERVGTEYRNVTMRANELSATLKSHKSLGQMYKRFSTDIRHAGQNLQTLGNTLTRLGTPMRRILSGTVFSAGYKLLGLMSEGFSRATQRADILATYKPVFRAMGAGLKTETDEWTKQLSDAYDKVYESVLGLPTGIDEIVNEWKLLTIATQDYDKAANLAIAANNAILASGADDAAQTTARRELRTLMTTGKLTERQWDSLRKGIPVAWNAIEQELKKQQKIEGSLLEALKGGKITAEEFGDLLIDEGINGKTKQVVNEMLHTYNAATANIRNAFANMGKNILGTLDDILKGATGKDTIDYLIGMKNVIGSFSEGVQQWMRDNKDVILDFMDTIKNFDYRGFFEGVGNGLKLFLEMFGKFAGWFDDKSMRWIGEFLTLAAPLGRAITLLGGTLKGFSKPLGLLAALIGRGGQLTGAKGGLFEGLLILLGGKGAKASTVVKEAETVASAAPTMGKAMSGLTKVFLGWAEIAAMVGGTAFTAWASMKLTKSTIKDLNDTVNLLGTVDWGMAKKTLAGIGEFLGSAALLSTVMGTVPADFSGNILFGEVVVGLFTTIATGFAKLDMSLIKGAIKDFSEALGYLEKIPQQLKELKSFGNVGVAKRRIREAVGVLNAVSEELEPERNTPLGEGGGKVKTISEGVTRSIANLASSIEAIKTSMSTLNEISGMRLNLKDLRNNVIPQLESALSSIGGLFERLPSTLGGTDTAGSITNLSSIMTNFQTAVNTLIGKKGILTQIPKINEKVKALAADPENNGLNDFMYYMRSLGDALKEAYKGLKGSLTGSGDMLTRMQNFEEAITIANSVIKKLKKFNTAYSADAGAVSTGNIETMIANLKAAFGAKKIGELKTEINNFNESIKTALQTIKDIGKEPVEIDAKVQLSSGFSASVSSVIKQINDAKKRIESTANSGISVTIPVSLRFSLSTNANAVVSTIGTTIDYVKRVARAGTGGSSGGSGGHPSEGATGGRISRNGVLYRSLGGSIFQPRGTDKIPAMLTEGEYVHKKQATDFWGLDFMRKVNAMDVRGAMDALLTRAGSATNIGRQSIYNHTVNNNQRVNMTVNTNNPNFAGARMGRFVGAL